MSNPIIAAMSRRLWPAPGWLPAALLLLAVMALGPQLGNSSRVLFVLGCAAAGWYAWQRSPAEHLQAALVLLSFAPLARRMVDLSVGFDPTGFMLVGPLFALLAPVPRLAHVLDSGRPLGRQTAPIIVVGACVAYATMLSMFQGDWMTAASGAVKWFTPLLYAAALSETSDADGRSLAQAAASAFLVILPITGLLGILQYVDPQPWDRFWMQNAPIMSVGQPLPYEVRVFSTMNGPASFATFTVVGLLLVCFLRSGWMSLLLAAPSALSLLLSQYRTAWLSMAVGLLFCFLLGSTRKRALAILLGILAAAVVASTLPPFADVIGERLQTLSDGSQDQSVQERLEQFFTVWNLWDSALVGSGFTTTDVSIAGAMPIDGMIIFCWVSMGMVVGLFCLAGFAWAGLNALDAVSRDPSAEAIVIAALVCGALVQMPFADIASGEAGFLFWTFCVLALLWPRPRVGSLSAGDMRRGRA